MNKSFWFGMAAGAALLVLVALVAIFASPVPRVLASSLSGNGPAGGPPWAQMWQHGGWQGGGPGFTLPPELQGLTTIPADQRFSHFEGVQVTLKDQNNQPLTVNVTPGKVSEADATHLTIAANNGKSQTFTLNDQTIIHAGAMPAPTGTPAAASTAASLKSGDDVVVVTLNNSDTATAVISGGPTGFAGPNHGGWWNHSGKGQ